MHKKVFFCILYLFICYFSPRQQGRAGQGSNYYCWFLTGGDAALTDDITADGQNGISFIHPMGEIFLQPLAGEAEPGTLHLYDGGL